MVGYSASGKGVKLVTEGLRGTELAIGDIVNELPEVGSNIMEDLANRLQVSAKNRVAPLDSGSGELKDSIVARWVNQWSMVVFAGQGIKRPQHAVHQEFGFAPHWIHKSQWMGDWSGWTSSDDFAYVRKHTPYMAPAVEEITKPSKVDEVIEKHLNPQIKKLTR